MQGSVNNTYKNLTDRNAGPGMSSSKKNSRVIDLLDPQLTTAPQFDALAPAADADGQEIDAQDIVTAAQNIRQGHEAQQDIAAIRPELNVTNDFKDPGALAQSAQQTAGKALEGAELLQNAGLMTGGKHDNDQYVAVALRTAMAMTNMPGMSYASSFRDFSRSGGKERSSSESRSSYAATSPSNPAPGAQASFAKPQAPQPDSGDIHNVSESLRGIEKIALNGNNFTRDMARMEETSKSVLAARNELIDHNPVVAIKHNMQLTA